MKFQGQLKELHEQPTVIFYSQIYNTTFDIVGNYIITAVFIKVATSTLYFGHVARLKIAFRSCDTAFRSCN